jgi:signal transduction histidine kinase
MRIRFILALTMSASLVTILLLAAAQWLSYSQVRKVNADLLLASEIRQTVMERIMLRDEYYVYREERPKAQWLVKTGLLGDQLKRGQARFAGTRDGELLEEMARESANIISLFRRLIENSPGNHPGQIERDMASEYDRKLFSQLNIKAFLLRDDASRLVERRSSEIVSLKKTSDWLFSGSLAIVLALVLVNGRLVLKILSKGISELQHGVSTIGDGHLDYRIGVDSNDEIGDLALGINKMAGALSASFTSIKYLDERIALRTAQLGASNRELEAFAYSVAHDLRAPLRSIDGFSRILQEESGAALDAEGVRVLGIIRSCAREMDALISNLLEMARLGRTELSYSTIDMKAMAGAVFEAIVDPEVAGSFEVRIGDLPLAQGDATMIERVWRNLLGNAIKYSIPSPVHLIEIGGSEEGSMKTYSVRDRGVGFDERYLDKLFGMFQRLHDKKDFEGTGVGLAIVERVVSRHGGKVWAEGRPGEGATFHFSLPARS